MSIATLLLILPLFLLILAGATAPIWIWKFKYLNQVRPCATRFDDEEVSVATKVKLAELRKSADYGNKIVIAHYFRNVVEDIADKFRMLAVLAAFITIGVFLWSLHGQFATLGALPPTEQLSRVTAMGFDSLKSGVSLMSFALMGVLVYFIRQEAAKFRTLLL